MTTENSDQQSLTTSYDPKIVEARWYKIWEQAGYFQPSEKGNPYTIVIPPPNVTGSLHMGHALNSTLQDVLIRYKKMTGHSALWVPGTDHGGIATQNVVEKLLKKEGTTRYTLGREKFLERMWKFRAETGDTILFQLTKLGATLDWTKTRFTMDEVCSTAVKTAFVRLYEKGLLYRGNRLVNWCPRCNTALADIEVEHKDVQGSLWHLRYPLLNGGHVIVATTRPETMLGDTAVAVNPKDERYANLIGSKIKLPLTSREIPIVADAAVDQTFGSGAVKVTPAHDQTDFEIAERHKLPHITVIGFDGKMTEAAGASYKGMDRFETRKKVVEDLEAAGLVEKIEPYKLSVSVCYRCDEVIEPLESEQWFLSMADMAARAREANKKGDVKIIPQSWEYPFQLWLENIRDWCVSRQIWWGHRIPVWYCVKMVNGKEEKTTCKPIVSIDEPKKCPTCQSEQIVQDSDVLDTWFSSALWPFSVFHWPEETADLKRFYPTSTLVTGHEILYLWVARMVMFGLEFRNEVPFKTVLIHGIVRDKQGRKMSKSLGNVIDPLDLIQQYGADAVRFSLAQSAAPGRDMHISPDNFIGARNFSNKIWNATRFALLHLKNMKEIPEISSVSKNLELSDRWILHRLNEVIQQTASYMEKTDLDAAARGLYEFFWADFCDWYLEMAKPRVDSENQFGAGVSDESRLAARVTLATVLEKIIQLLHPFMPFITEELWEKIPKSPKNSTSHVMASKWPTQISFGDASNAVSQMKWVQELATKLRAIRSEMGIPVTQRIDVVFKSPSAEIVQLLKSQETILKSLNTKVNSITVDAAYIRTKGSATAIVPQAEVFVPLEGLIDFSKEKARLEKEMKAVQDDLDRISKKLSNQDFVAHAPEEEISKAKKRFADGQERLHHLTENIKTLS